MVNKMAYSTIIFFFLLVRYRYSVNFTGDEIKVSESTFSDSFLIESSWKRKTAIGSAKAVHFRKSYIAGKRNVIIWFFREESEESCRSCAGLSNDYVNIFFQAVTSLNKNLFSQDIARFFRQILPIAAPKKLTIR